jgi:glycosyltransferase involved in cell wall biosynthesis
MHYDILIFADGNSIHTARWVEGLAVDERFRLHLLSMNPAGWHRDIDRYTDMNRIATRQIIAPAKINKEGGNHTYLWLLPALRRAIKKIKLNLINAHYLSSYGSIAALLRPQGCHLVQTIHGTDGMVFPWRSQVHTAISAFALNRADLVFSVSDRLTEKIAGLINTRNRKPPRVLTLQYGLKDDLFAIMPGAPAYDIISNRAWVENSNIPLIAWALKQIAGARRFLICGDQIGMSAAERTRLFDDSRFEIRAEIPNAELIGLIARSRVYVSMTRSDGTSLSLLEAMALGAIPVVSDLPENRVWITHGVNGFLVSGFDTTTLVDTIEQALSLSDTDRQRMQSVNRTAVQAKASFTTNMAKIRSYFMELCTHE